MLYRSVSVCLNYGGVFKIRLITGSKAAGQGLQVRGECEEDEGSVRAVSAGY